MFKKEIMKINYSKLPHVPSRTFSSFSILSHFRVCIKYHKKRSSQQRLGVGKGFQGWAITYSRTRSSHAQHECPGRAACLKEWLLLPLSFPNAAGEGWNWDLKCRESFQSSVRTCSYFWRQVLQKEEGNFSKYFLQAVQGMIPFKNSSVSPTLWNKSPVINCNQSLGQLSVLVMCLELCCIHREKKKPNQN